MVDSPKPAPTPEKPKLSEQDRLAKEYQDRWGAMSQEEIFAEFAKSDRYKDCKDYSEFLSKIKEDEKLKDLHERLTKHKPAVSSEKESEREQLDAEKKKNKQEQQKKAIDLQADIDKKKVDLETEQTALDEKKEKVENIEKKLNTVKSGEKPEEPKPAENKEEKKEKKKFDPKKNWIRKGLSPITATVSGVVGAIPKAGGKLLSTITRPQDIFTKSYWKHFWKQEADHGAKTRGPEAESGKRIKTPIWFAGKVVKGPLHGAKTALHAVQETVKGLWKWEFPYTATKHSWKKMLGWNYQGGEKIEEKKK